MSLFPRALAPFIILMLCVIVPTGAVAATPGTGGTAYKEEPPPPPMLEPGLWTGPEVPGTKAVLLEDGTAAAPADAPEQVKQAVWAANSLQAAALPLRRRPQPRVRRRQGRRLLRHRLVRAPCRRPAQDAAGLRLVHAVGPQRQGRLDHRLHEPRPRLRRRSPASGSTRASAGMSRTRGHRRLGVRARPALAPDAPFAARLRAAPPRLVLARPRAGYAWGRTPTRR